MMRASALRRRQRGTSALETAMCLPVLILVIGMAADTAWLGLTRHQIDHAVRLASRYGITGQAESVPSGSAMVPLCPGTATAASPRIDRIRAIIAADTSRLFRPSSLCLGLASYAGYQGVGRPEPIADINGNGRHDAGEAFTDINGNGRWDPDQAVAGAGGGDQVAIYTLRFTAHPLVGVTPGMPANIPIEGRVVVRNEPF